MRLQQLLVDAGIDLAHDGRDALEVLQHDQQRGVQRLGLRALVRLHRGELSLTSELGYGTTVTVIFPPETAAAKQVAPMPLPPAEFVSMRAA